MAAKRARSKDTPGVMPNGFVPLDTKKFLGFERVEHVPKSSYRDCSMVIIIPCRSPQLHVKVVQAIQGLQWPMNGKRAMFFVTGAEVGQAYDDQVAAILAHPELGQWKYVLTLEDDNIPPPEAPLLLLEAIEAGPFDGVGGLYFTKGDLGMPQCYGDPALFASTGELDFRPRDVVAAIKQNAIVPCNGIAMGCSLYRMSAFRDIPRPWFQSNPSNTQDLFFCSKAVRSGKRFACDCRVRVGHIDVSSGIVY
jgi:hypothetical protein